MERINDKITQAYIDKFLENNYEVSYREVPSDLGLRTYFYDELPTVEAEGYPISSDYVLDGRAYTMQQLDSLTEEQRGRLRLRYYYMPCYHEMYVGTTGSGKTTGCVEPQLRAISSQRNKPNLFITDPKGELYARNARHLRQNGYRLFILNFKDIAHSERWNPLDELYLMKQRAAHIYDEINIVLREYLPVGVRYADKQAAEGEACYVFDGVAYADMAAAEKAAAFARDVIEIDIDSIIVQLINMFITVKSTHDPMWEYGAQDGLRGIIYAMLEESVTDSAFTRDMMTLKTIQQYFISLRDHVINKQKPLQEHPLVKGKSSKVISNMTCMFDNAPTTMRCYCGVFENSMKDWFSGHILALTLGNTVDLQPTADSPFAIFVVTRDYEKSDFQVAGMFVDWVYRTMLQAFENKQTTRATHFLLDEFGNIPEIRHFENKIATARSRNLWFHLVVQSYMQLDAVYGKDAACIIRDNCNAQIFLGSQNADTKEIFSRECGNHYIPTLRSVYDSRLHEIEPVRLVPISEIEQIKPGDAIIKRYGCPVIHACYIRSYVCAAMGTFAHFSDDALYTLVPDAAISLQDERFTYKKALVQEQPPAAQVKFRF